MKEMKHCAMTHGGKFHADDVFSAALLRILYPEIAIVRAFTIPDDFDGIVFDMGFGTFDHHQEDSEVRENGVPYAAFGLLWRTLGQDVLIRVGCPAELAEEEALRFDANFVQPLDESDNTGCKHELASVISTFNASWDMEECADECFEEAVSFATIILEKRFDSILSAQRAKTMVEEALENMADAIVVLPQYAPWKKILVPSDAKFVVYPSQRGGFSAQVIPIDLESNVAKCLFPLAWAGKSESELPKISGIDTLRFCHKGRFLITTGCLADVLRACKLAQESDGKEAQ